MVRVVSSKCKSGCEGGSLNTLQSYVDQIDSIFSDPNSKTIFEVDDGIWERIKGWFEEHDIVDVALGEL